MLKIIEVMLVLILVRNQILGQVNDIEVDINVAVKHNWIPKIYQKSFIERANLYLESIKIHNNNEISNLLGTHFNCRGKRVVYSMEQKDLLVNKINETQLIDYKILNIGYSTENFGLPFQKRK